MSVTTAAEPCDLLGRDVPHAEAVEGALPPAEQLEPGSAAPLARALADPSRLDASALGAPAPATGPV